MKIKRYFIGIQLLFSLFFVGCSMTKEDNIETVNITTTPKQSIDLSQDIREIDESVIDDNAIRLKDGFADSSLQVMVTSDEAFQINEINSKSNFGGEQNNVLIAKDHTNDILYYINAGEDFFIYRRKDGVSQLVVDIPAANLHLQNGLMYFMVRSYHKYNFYDIQEGNILSYDPISGKVEMVVDEQVDAMYVYADGFDWYKLFYTSDTEYDTEKYTYLYETGQSVDSTTTGYSYRRDEYQLDFILGEEDEKSGYAFPVESIWLNQRDKSYIQISDKVIYEDIALTQSKLYGLYNDGSFGIFHMDSHEINYMDLKELETEALKKLQRPSSPTGVLFYSYTLLDNTIYFATPSIIYFKEDDNLHAYAFYLSDQPTPYSIVDLFTDGSNLYALLGTDHSNKISAKLYQIDFGTVDLGGLIANKILVTQL